MSVLGLKFGASLREAQISQGVVGKAVRGLVMGTVFSLGAMLALGAAPTPAHADFVQFDLDTEFSGAQDPAGGTPWLTMAFEDIVGGVRMTIDAAGLVASEFASVVFFNIENDYEEPSSVTHVPVSQTASGSDFQEHTAAMSGSDLNAAFKADGDGYFDARFDYTNGAFTAGEKSVYDLMGLTVAQIIATSVKGPADKTGFYVAAHIQGIAGGGSGWITGGINPIPLPPAAFLFLSGLVGMGLLARRRRTKLGAAAA